MSERSEKRGKEGSKKILRKEEVKGEGERRPKETNFSTSPRVSDHKQSIYCVVSIPRSLE